MVVLRHKHVAAMLAFCLWAVGCGTLVGNPEDEASESTPNDAGTGTLQASSLTFHIADAPIDHARSVFVTIAGVEVKQDGGDWLEIPLVADQEIDLLRYQDGDSLRFAETGPLPAGLYSKTRLMLSQTVRPRIVLSDGTEDDLVVPGGSEHGIELTTAFAAEPGQDVDITLDFDLRRSLKLISSDDRDVYVLQPVLRLLKDGEYGHVEGQAPEGRLVCVFPEGTEPDDDDACEHALNSALIKNGRYKLPHLPGGNYKIQVYDASGKAIAGKKSPAQVSAMKYKKNHGDRKNNGKGKNQDRSKSSRLPK